MSEENDGTGELNEAVIVMGMVFVAHNEATEVKQPGKEPFNLPPATVAAQRSAVLGLAIGTAPRAVERDHFNPVDGFQVSIKPVAVVGFVANQSLRHGIGYPAFNRQLCQRHFSRRSTGCAEGHRKTSALSNCHDLGPFAALGFANKQAPFLAGAKVPSMKHLLKSRPPRSLRS